MRRLLAAAALVLWTGGCGDRGDLPAHAASAQAPPQKETVAQPAPPPAPEKPRGLEPAPEWAPSAPSDSGRPAVLLLGIDGADWKVLDVLFEAGYLPNLARLAREGARAELDCTPAMPETACFCPPVWVSIATGEPYEQHRISTLHHEVGDRDAVAVWDVLAAEGGTTTLDSFRNTWPPEASAKYVLTEYGLDWASGQIYERLPVEKPLLREMMAHLRFKPEDLLEQLGMLPHEGAKDPAWKSVARDRVAMEALRRLAQRDRTDLTVALIHGPDKAQHLGWGAVQKTPQSPFDAQALLAQARAWKGPVRAKSGRAGTNVASQYLETDAWLGRLLSEVGWDYIVVASDHGMTRNPGKGLAGHHGIESPEGHQGVLILWGPGVREGASLRGVDVFDVAPTLAWLLRLPVAENLPGEVLTRAFEPAWIAEHPVRRVASWKSAPAAPLVDPAASQLQPPDARAEDRGAAIPARLRDQRPKMAGSTSMPTGQ